MNIERLKVEFRRNKTKTMVLGGLLVVLGVFGAKAYFDGAPQAASASIATDSGAAGSAAIKTGEMEAKVQQADELWKIMRTKRGLVPAKAYVLDGDKYKYTKTYTPPTVASVTQDNKIVEARQVPTGPTAEELEKMKQEMIGKEANQLVLQAVLNGSTPTALINSKQVSVGDQISGFKVLTIEDRLVRAVKDGVEVVIPLRDASFQRGQ